MLVGVVLYVLIPFVYRSSKWSDRAALVIYVINSIEVKFTMSLMNEKKLLILLLEYFM